MYPSTCRSMVIPVRTPISSAPSDRLPRVRVRPSPKSFEAGLQGCVHVTEGEVGAVIHDVTAGAAVEPLTCPLWVIIAFYLLAARDPARSFSRSEGVSFPGPRLIAAGDGLRSFRFCCPVT